MGSPRLRPFFIAAFVLLAPVLLLSNTVKGQSAGQVANQAGSTPGANNAQNVINNAQSQWDAAKGGPYYGAPHGPDSNYTVGVCEDASWRDAIFLKDNSPQGTMDGITKWPSKEVIKYVKKYWVPAAIPNIVFAGLTLLAFIIFAVWRLVRFCCICCCAKASCKAKSSEDPQVVLRGTLIIVLKVVIVLFAVAAIGMAIAGMAKEKKKVLPPLWVAVDSFTNYTDVAITKLDQIVNTTRDLKPVLSNLSSNLTNSALGIFDRTGTVSSAKAQINSALAQVDSTVKAFQDSAKTLRDNFSRRLKDLEKDHRKDTEDADKIRWEVIIALLCAGILGCVLITAFVFLNCQFWLSFSIVYTLVVAFIWFIITFALALVTQGNSEVCYHMESLVISTTSSTGSQNISQLAGYYFFGPPTLDVKIVLKTSKIVDVDQVLSLANNSTAAVISSINRAYASQTPSMAVPSGVQSSLTSIANSSAAINVLTSQALALAHFNQIHPLWVNTKSFICCDVPDEFTGIWVIATFGGWLLLILSCVAMAYLSRLDKVNTGFYGCHCIILGRADRVHPDSGGAKGSGDTEQGGQPNEPPRAVVVDKNSPQYASAMGGGNGPAGAPQQQGGQVAAPAAVAVAAMPPAYPAQQEQQPQAQWPMDPNTGFPLPMDPQTGFPVRPETGRPFDPSTGLDVDPSNVMPPQHLQAPAPAAGGWGAS